MDVGHGDLVLAFRDWTLGFQKDSNSFGFLRDFGLGFLDFGFSRGSWILYTVFQRFQINKKLIVNVVSTFGFSMDWVLKKCYWTVGNSG
jgi:hypothetical protein